MMVLNATWFKAQLSAQGKSQAALAKFLELDRASVTRILQGKRRLQLEECKKAARFLGVPVDQVLENAGINLRHKTASGKTVYPVIGYSDEHSQVLMGTGDTSISTEISVPSECVAVRMREPEGWTAFVLQERMPPYLMVLRLVMACCDDGSYWMGELRRGYEPGTFTLFPVRGDAIEGLVIAHCQPIVWLRPSS